jgi:hypothetical protein
MSKLHLATWLALAAVTPTATLAAQEQETPAEGSAAALERFESLQAEVDETMNAWNQQLREKIKQAKEAGEELPESEYDSPLGEFLTRFQEAAAEYAGTEDAVQFHVWIVMRGAQADMEVAKSSFDTLCSTYVASPGLEPLASILPYVEQMFGDVQASLTRLSTDSSLPVVRDWSSFAIYSGQLESASAGTDEFADALAKLIATMESTEDARLKTMIERKVAIAETFAPGMVAPEIEGIDLDGTAFKLSDYEGKIVFLDFWGDW